MTNHQKHEDMHRKSETTKLSEADYDILSIIDNGVFSISSAWAITRSDSIAQLSIAGLVGMYECHYERSPNAGPGMHTAWTLTTKGSKVLKGRKK